MRLEIDEPCLLLFDMSSLPASDLVFTEVFGLSIAECQLSKEYPRANDSDGLPDLAVLLLNTCRRINTTSLKLHTVSSILNTVHKRFQDLGLSV
jgi:hypothetical protein